MQGDDSGSRLSLAWREALERFRSSLFGIPALWLIGAVVVAQVAILIDRRIDPEDLPVRIATNVDSARALLGAVASGTIAAASLVFTLTLVAIQLSSSSYSSRVLRMFLRDRFQQHMIGLVLGAFLYCLLVLRVVGDVADGRLLEQPAVSVTLATLFALAAVLALLASISHTAQQIRVSMVSARIMTETMDAIGPAADSAAPHGQPQLSVEAPGVVPSPLGVTSSTHHAVAGSEPSEGIVLTATSSGWVQQIGPDAVAAAVPRGSTVRLEVAVGTYVMAGSPLATVWLPHDAAEESFDKPALRKTIRVGRERTLQQDVGFGLLMLEDIALRALSPGIDDPNTARSILPQLGEIVLAVLQRPAQTAVVTMQDRTLMRADPPGPDDYVRAAFDQIRRRARDKPEVQLALVRTLMSVSSEVRRRDCADPSRATAALDEMIHRVAMDLPAASDDPAVLEARGLVDAP